MSEQMKPCMCCPRCGKKWSEINGLYVFCRGCDHMEDSTFEQITGHGIDKIMNRRTTGGQNG